MMTHPLGPYQPIEQLEEGGPYSTHRAIDPRMFGQPVAITAAPIPAGDTEFVRRFEQGATALTALRHPNILPLLDFGETAQQIYLVTPFLEGPTLATIIGQPRRPVEALSLIATLCEALDHAHRGGLPHGALSPEAIQLVNLPPGEDTLFAAWPIVRYHGFAPLIGPGETAIAVAYIPAAGAASNEPKGDDFYALAGILQALLTGVSPADEGAEAALNTLPEGLAATLHRARAADPAARFNSGADFVLALRDASTAARRNEDQHAGGLLDEARNAVAAGKLRAASEAYSAYLLVRPQDELARREFATIESRRTEMARRRAESAAAAAARAASAPPPNTSQVIAAPTAEPPATVATAPVEQEAGEDDWSANPLVGAAPQIPAPRFELRNIFSFGNTADNQTSGRPLGPGGLGTTRQAARSAPPRDFRPIAAPARLRRQAVLPAAIAAAVLILLLAIGGALVSRQRGQQAANPTQTGFAATASPQSANATRTATRIAQNVPPVIPIVPTLPPRTPTPVPTLPPLNPVITDTFGDPNTGFPREPGGFVDAGYQTGEYILRVPEPDGFEIAELVGCAQVPGCVFGDMVLEVDARAVGSTAGGSYGVVFHRQFAGAYIQYFVLVDPELGQIRLVRWNDTERVEVIPPTPLAQILKGENVNHLTITTKGATITVGVNGANLPTITDPAGPLFGIVALRADAGTAPIEVRFDNFIIRPVR
ncbi:MAG TPA: hypothetical protein VIL85_08340 [Thermomicrobiales bacterium]|jgi:hypothetical protein